MKTSIEYTIYSQKLGQVIAYNGIQVGRWTEDLGDAKKYSTEQTAICSKATEKSGTKRCQTQKWLRFKPN